MTCQFRGCDGVVEGERKFYKYCEKHNCLGCSVYDKHDIIIHVKKAHHVRRGGYSYMFDCAYNSINFTHFVDDCCDMSSICRFNDCEKTVLDKTFCVDHRKYECTTCHDMNTKENYGRCNRCINLGKYYCRGCDRFCIGRFMAAGTKCVYCRYHTGRHEMDYGPMQVIGDYVKNKYDYISEMQYPIKLYKSYNRQVKDPFYNSLVKLPQEIISIILTYANLQPSYVTVQKLISLHRVKELILFFLFI